MGVFAELKRRNVFRVSGVYAVVGWVLLQVATVLEDVMGLPDGFDGFVLAVLLIGFPLALIFAWAFELTPEGLKRTAGQRCNGPAPRYGRRAPTNPASRLVAALWGLALVTGIGVLPLLAHAQSPDPSSSTPPSESAGRHAESALFDSARTLPLTLEFPIRSLRQGQPLDDPVAGTVRVRGKASENVLDVEVMTRGHSRLLLCDLPPLKLNFRRSQVGGTVFAGQNKLKLVTHCQRGRKFERYLHQEYALYRAYGVLTDEAFRVRMLEVTYRDSEGRRRDRTHPAFLIEADPEVTARLGYEEVEVPRMANGDFDPGAITRMGLFEFMIGNTDWALRTGRGNEPCCHNGLLLRRPDGLHVMVPYDFDQAGLIDADYALPADGLGIRTVRQRLFRGLCTGDAAHDAAIALFNAHRGEIEALFPQDGDRKRSNRRARHYVADFFEIVNDPRERQEWIGDSCRGRPSEWE